MINHLPLETPEPTRQPPSQLLVAYSIPARMEKRQKLLADLARHLTLRNLTTDEEARAAINERVRDIESRLAEMDQSAKSYHRGWS